MNKALAIIILCAPIYLSSADDDRDADFKVAIQSNPNIIVIKGLDSLKALAQEIQKFPAYITHTQRSMHIAGTMFIGCALCCAGIYSFIKNDKKELKDYIFNVGFIGIGAGLVLFSPSISRLMIPMTT